MIAKALTDITPEDLRSWLEAGLDESRTVDLKRDFLGLSEGDKKDLAKDVCALANGDGGWLIYGVDEDDVPPHTPVGLPGFKADSDWRRYEQCVLQRIAPRVSLDHKVLEGFERGPILIVQIRPSWSKPHMVTTGESRFWQRGGRSNSPMDVEQIRTAFAMANEAPRDVQRWVDDRIDQIAREGTAPPVAMHRPVFVLHMVPLDAELRPTRIDPRRFHEERPRLEPFRPMGRLCRSQFVLEGFRHLELPERNSDHTLGYTLGFRSGAVEVVAVARESEEVVPLAYWHGRACKVIGDWRTALTDLEVYSPLLISAALLNARRKVAVGNFRGFGELHGRFDRNIVNAPTVVLENGADIAVMDVVRPAFDAMWNAAGLSEWPSPDQE